jgi:hypothetical protein
MAVSNKNLMKMEQPDKDLYLKLRQAIDSFSDVLLGEFDMTKPGSTDRQDFCNLMRTKLEEAIDDIAEMRQEHWKGMALSRARDFKNHAGNLKKSAVNKERAACPPGFIDIDGVCVPI